MTLQGPRPEARQVRVLWNPSSGRTTGIGAGEISRDALLDLMARHGLGSDLHETRSAGDAGRLAREAVDRDYDVVVAAGGDGTIAPIARELLDSPTALGILPLGTVMNIPRMLGIERDLEVAAELIEAGRRRLIDVGMADGTVFYEAASVGIHAASSRELNQADHADYGAMLRSIVAAIRYRPSRMTIELDGSRRIQTRALLVAVANGPFMGPGFTIAPDASLEDGLFDVRIFLGYSKTELVRHLFGIAFGRRRYEPRARTERAATVRIMGRRPLPARADSADLGSTPVLFRTRPQALWVIAGS
jgi:YegS/Rv2252/BmrU family lipid kinase